MTTATRIGISLSDEDKRVLLKLEERFGKIGTTAIIRIALKYLERVND